MELLKTGPEFKDYKLIALPITNNRTMSSPVKRDKKQQMLHSTGTPGGKATSFAKNMNYSKSTTSVEFIIDETGGYQLMDLNLKSWHAGTAYEGGPSANNTHYSCEICEPMETIFLPINWRNLYRGGPYNKSYAVTRLQQELAYLKLYNIEIDGKFGPGTKAAVIAYQKSVGISQDGSVGPTTLKYLQKREGSFLRYNASLVQEYFEYVYDFAVSLFASLTKYCGSDPMKDIICHSEGYKAGIASNHADVMHWFPQHGKSMDSFRADVAARVAGTETKPESELDRAIRILGESGAINSPDYWAKGNYSASNVQFLLIAFGKYVEEHP